MLNFVTHRDAIQPYLVELNAVLAAVPHRDVEAIVELLLATYDEDRTVFIAGNGGSAATASHFANDLTKATIVPGQRRFRVIALTDNVPLLTAWANDASYADAFAEQLRSLIRPGDLFIAISGSGNSENILRAADFARSSGARVAGFTGFDGGKLVAQCDRSVLVPCSVMAQVEDAHLIIQHAVCSYLREVIAHAAHAVSTAAADG
ncbi:MAG TPA: SIS domain-containing protein [Thermomicrobiales bacterium]